MIYAIDFDGTIVEDKYPEIGELYYLAEKFIRKLKANGDTFIIHTCRHGESLKEALNFLQQHGLEPDYINENVPELIAKYGDCRKIYADVYIDDHNSGGVRWPWETLRLEGNDAN